MTRLLAAEGLSSPAGSTGNRALALKAEVVLSVQLITRHRVPRLALLLAGILLLALFEGDPAGVVARQRTVLLIAGSLGAVAGARLLARGGPLGGARCAAAPALLPPVGRLIGALLLVGPVLLAVTMATLGSGPVLAGTVIVALVYAAASVVAAMALTPAVGTSLAAALGFVSALAGLARPSQVAVLLGAWPVPRAVAGLLWNGLPLPWRAGRWLTQGASAGDPWVLLGWIVAGLLASAWVVERVAERSASAEPA